MPITKFSSPIRPGQTGEALDRLVKAQLAKEAVPRKKEIEDAIAKTEARMVEVRKEAAVLLSKEQQDSPAYDDLAQKHRLLRRKAEFFSDIISDMEKDVKAGKRDLPQEEINKASYEKSKAK